jgi:(1->4)-alpha-D-glucan 1-alpha-D-glucosylmutase
VDPAGEKLLTELYAEFTGESTDWTEVARAKKHEVMQLAMGSDLNRLTALFLEVCEHRRRYRDYTRHELHEALRDTLACFSVYRTYVRPEPAPVDAEDVRRIVEATETPVRTGRTSTASCSSSFATCCVDGWWATSRPS